MRDTSIFRRYYLVSGAVLMAVVDFNLIRIPTYDFNWFFNVVSFFVLTSGAIWEVVATLPTKEKQVEALLVPMLDTFSFTLQFLTGVEIRIAVFLLERKWNKNASSRIRIAFHSSNMKGSPDLVVKFEKWQGLAGHVWGRNKSASADLTVVQNQNIEFWNLDETQIALTKNLKAIYGTPITYPSNSEELIGIITFDTKSVYLHSNPRKGRMYRYFSQNAVFMGISAQIKVYVAKLLQHFNLIRPLEKS